MIICAYMSSKYVHAGGGNTLVPSTLYNEIVGSPISHTNRVHGSEATHYILCSPGLDWLGLWHH